MREIRTLGLRRRGWKPAYDSASKELPRSEAIHYAALGSMGISSLAQLFGLSFEFCFKSFLSLGVSSVPDGMVIFDLFFDHGVKDHGDLVGGCHGGAFGAQFGLHSTQVVA